MLARITDKAAPMKPLGLVLVPTRELAVQVAEVLQPVAAQAGMKVIPVYGGASRHHQVEEMAEGVEIVVATPLRLIDLIKSDEISLDDIQIVTLDEADRMADDGFTPQVEWILRHCGNRNQTMLFSATLDGDVGHLIRAYQTDPETVAIDEATDTIGTMRHLFLGIHHMDRDKVIGAIARGIPKLVVFCQTKRQCDRATEKLQDLGIDALAIHGDLQQKTRERVMRSFAEGKLQILVATDVAARGIDIDDIGAVIHYEPAKDVKDYLHRSGRTARAGRDGWAVTLVGVQPGHAGAHPAADDEDGSEQAGGHLLERPPSAEARRVRRGRQDLGRQPQQPVTHTAPDASRPPEECAQAVERSGR